MPNVYTVNPEGRFDTIELRFELLEAQDLYADENSYLLTQSIFVNGDNLAPHHAIYLPHLAKSCQSSGEFSIVTCGCGDAGCAGIDDGIRVTHEGDRIVWHVPDPLSYAGMSTEEAERTANNRQYDTYVFQPDQYLETILTGLNKAKALLFGDRQPIECSPYGFDSEDLLRLDPRVFSERGAPEGCHLIAKEIVLKPFRFGIAMNNIAYRLRELPVPEEIKALDDWSDWEPLITDRGTFYNCAAAPKWECRRRMKILARYLASMQSPPGCVVLVDRPGRVAEGERWERRLALRGSRGVVEAPI